jgi:hypothetical protein
LPSPNPENIPFHFPQQKLIPWKKKKEKDQIHLSPAGAIEASAALSELPKEKHPLLPGG